MKVKILVTGIILLLSFSFLPGQNLEYVSETLFSDYINSFGLIDNYVLLGCGSSMQILSLDSPSSPEVVRNVPRGFGYDFRIRDNTLFSTGGSFIISDISDPLNPEIIGLFNPGYYSAIGAANIQADYAFVSTSSEYDYYSQFIALDITNLSFPEPVCTLDFSPGIFDIVIDDSLAILAQGSIDYEGHLHIVDISNPLALETLSSMEISEISGIAVSGSRVYAADSYGLSIIDISDPTNPEIISYFEGIGGGHMLVSNNVLYTNEGNGIKLYDISNGDFPVQISSYELGHYVFVMQIENDTLHYCTKNYDLYEYGLLDVSDVENITPIGIYQRSGPTQSVAVENDHAYVLNGNNGLAVVDISNPAHPRICDNSTFGNSFDFGDYIRTNEGIAYICRDAGVSILDISNPNEIEELGHYYLSDYHRGFAIKDSLLYISVQDYGLKILNAANPNSIAVIDSVGVYESIRTGISLSGHYLALNNTYDCRLIDISDPSDAFEVQTIASPIPIANLTLLDSTLYMCRTADPAFEIIDISDISNPISIDTVSLFSYIKGTCLFDNMMLITERHALELFDISDPHSPVVLDTFEITAYQYDVTFGDGYIYLAISRSLQIMRLTETGLESIPDIPLTFSLSQNYPNPFNAQTQISYTLPSAGPVKLAVYDILGRQVQTLFDDPQAAGEHSVIWDADGFASGIYFYRLTAGDKEFSRQMTLIK